MARIRQNPMGKIIKIGSGVNFRIARRARLAPGVREVKQPREVWRLR